MSGVWLTVAVVGVGTAAIKALGPVALGGRPVDLDDQRARLLAVAQLLADPRGARLRGVDRPDAHHVEAIRPGVTPGDGDSTPGVAGRGPEADTARERAAAHWS